MKALVTTQPRHLVVRLSQNDDRHTTSDPRCVTNTKAMIRLVGRGIKGALSYGGGERAANFPGQSYHDG